MQQLRLIWRDPTLRMVAGLMALQGALLCTFGPFVSVLAVRSFGLGDAGYAAVMFTSTLVERMKRSKDGELVRNVDSSLEAVEEAGHCSHDDDPAAVNAAIDRVCRRF